MNYGSVCSGIEAATVAWDELDWNAAWFAEIDKFPSAVLKHHYPNVPNIGDMTKIARAILVGDVAAPDVLVGGTPCQAYSVAGLREGLADERGQLTISYVRLFDAIDYIRERRGEPAAVALWENVPGVLSSKDNAFGCFLAGLAGEGRELEPPRDAKGKAKSWPNAGCVFGPTRTIAWRVLDAQYFGVAQRRRRVFVVASARKDFNPVDVLFESDGVRRDTAPRREAREEVAGTLAASLGRRRGAPAGGDDSGHLQPVASTGDVSHCLNAGGMGRQDYETETLIAQPAYAIQAGALRTNPNSGPDGVGVQEGVAYTMEARAEVQAVCVTGEITHTLKAEGFDASENGTGRGQPIVAAFDSQQITSPHNGARVDHDAPAPTMAKESRMHAVTGMAVRRLTPRECERLQGFPDDYTLIPYGRAIRPEKLDEDWIKYLMRGGVMTREECARAAADGPRYKSLGNSMAVPCMRWLGKRLDRELKRATTREWIAREKRGIRAS
jgi:DNA (cytosine-5)-methyltransferase 1